MKIIQCYGLNSVFPKSHDGAPAPNEVVFGDVASGKSQGRALVMGLAALQEQEEKEISLSLSATA